MQHLPHDSSLVPAVEPAAAWGPVEHLLANLVDVGAIANWQRAQAGSSKSIPRPQMLERPGRSKSRKPTLTPEQVRERLRDLHARQEVARGSQRALQGEPGSGP